MDVWINPKSIKRRVTCSGCVDKSKEEEEEGSVRLDGYRERQGCGCVDKFKGE